MILLKEHRERDIYLESLYSTKKIHDSFLSLPDNAINQQLLIM